VVQRGGQNAAGKPRLRRRRAPDATSEWENCKWGPLRQAPSLVDAQGNFYPTTSQRPDFPPQTGFLESGWRIDEVEKELRAQIELAKKMIPQVSHLSSHMNTPTATPQLGALCEDLRAWQRSRNLKVVRLPPKKISPRKENRARP
jgi:predicted glycoside hydrolase/deacetylase ChbG (UPF0249 family)